MVAKRVTQRDQKPDHKKVTLSLHAPEAQSVEIAGTFCNWQPGSHPMKKDRKGTWSATLPLAPGNYEYRYLVDGEWQDDPCCPTRVPNPFGTHNCVLEVVREELQARHASPLTEAVS